MTQLIDYNSMLQEFTCAVCREPFLDPVTLPCGHTFCKECVLHMRSISSTQLTMIGHLRSVGNPMRGSMERINRITSTMPPIQRSSVSRTLRNSRILRSSGSLTNDAASLNESDRGQGARNYANDAGHSISNQNQMQHERNAIDDFPKPIGHGTISCPLCRESHHIVSNWLKVNVLMQNIMMTYFQEHTAERSIQQKENEMTSLCLFIFREDVCLLPGRDLLLNIFETKYRKMLQRCITSKRFGVLMLTSSDYDNILEETNSGNILSFTLRDTANHEITVDTTTTQHNLTENEGTDHPLNFERQFAAFENHSNALNSSPQSPNVQMIPSSSSASDLSNSEVQRNISYLDEESENLSSKVWQKYVGVLATIEEAHILPDGRAFLRVYGGNRFKIVGEPTLMNEGYYVGDIEWLHDEDPTEEEIRLAQDARARLEGLLEKFFQSLTFNESNRHAFFDRHGAIPDDNELFSYWIAKFLALSYQEKMRLLTTTNTTHRLEILYPIMKTRLRNWKIMHRRKKMLIYSIAIFIVSIIMYHILVLVIHMSPIQSGLEFISKYLLR